MAACVKRFPIDQQGPEKSSTFGEVLIMKVSGKDSSYVEVIQKCRPFSQDFKQGSVGKFLEYPFLSVFSEWK